MPTGVLRRAGEAMGENFYPTQAAFSLSPFSILAGRHANGALHSGEEGGREVRKKFLAKKYARRKTGVQEIAPRHSPVLYARKSAVYELPFDGGEKVPEYD